MPLDLPLPFNSFGDECVFLKLHFLSFWHWVGPFLDSRGWCPCISSMNRPEQDGTLCRRVRTESRLAKSRAADGNPKKMIFQNEAAVLARVKENRSSGCIIRLSNNRIRTKTWYQSNRGGIELSEYRCRPDTFVRAFLLMPTRDFISSFL